MNYTSEQFNELVTCSESCSYFARRYVIKKPLFDDQLTWLEYKPGYKMIGDERRSGRTTAMLARAAWMFVFKPKTTTVYLAPTMDLARMAHEQFKQILAELPDFMQDSSPINRHTREEFVSLDHATVKFQRASENATRGYGCSLVMLDNASLMSDRERHALNNVVMPCLVTGSTFLVSW